MTTKNNVTNQEKGTGAYYGGNDMNDVTLKGRLGKTPSIRMSSEGSAIANFTLAVSSGYGDKEKTNWIPIRVLGKQGETVADNLDAGSAVLVKGSLVVDQWKEGDTSRYYTYVLARRVIFLDKKKQSAA